MRYAYAPTRQKNQQCARAELIGIGHCTALGIAARS